MGVLLGPVSDASEQDAGGRKSMNSRSEAVALNLALRDSVQLDSSHMSHGQNFL